MPRFTCESCAAPLYSAALPADLNHAACPACGVPFPLESGVESSGMPVEPVPATL